MKYLFERDLTTTQTSGNIGFETRLILAFLLLLICGTFMFGQNPKASQGSNTPTENRVVADSLTATNDSLSASSSKKKQKKDQLVDAEVKYSAKDSIVLSPKGQKFYLYGGAALKYRDIDLTAAYIELDMDSTTAYACGVEDSSGVMQGLPVFKDKSGTFTMNTMKYNFKTQKALIEHVVTQQGEGYVVAGRSKKMNDNTFYLKNGHYSTCDDHDCPHFYLNLTKAKFIPGKKTITGPVYLVVEDVPFYPLFLPFAIIPSTSKYSSGVIMPTYGMESAQGLFLRDGGYYWAANQYFDLAATGSIYSNGSWGTDLASTYKWKYHLSGNFDFRTNTTLTSEEDLPDFRKQQDMSLRWSHSPDAKANPYSSLSASVNISTASFEQNNITNLVNTQQLATSTKQSSISYSKRFPNSPINFSLNALESQNSRDSSINITLPDFTLNASKIFPFKSKTRIGEERWFEKVSFAYTGSAKNQIQSKESELASKSLATDWQNGVQHQIPLSINLKFLKYFTSSPTFTYNEKWYFKSITKDYDYTKGAVVTSQTRNGFYRVYDYSTSIGTSTKTYLFMVPDKRIFGDKVKAFRHVMTPSVNLSYKPDFGSEKYGYYNNLDYYNAATDTITHLQYSKYENAIYGTPAAGESANMSLSLGNTLDMKVKSLKDTTGVKKIALLESFNVSSGYNFLADSLNYSLVNMSGRTSVFGTGINFGATFDPYAMDTTKFGQPIRINHSNYTKTGDLLRLTSANIGFGITLNNAKFKRKVDNKMDAGLDSLGNEAIPGESLYDPNDPMGLKKSQGSTKDKMVKGNDGYAKFTIPWSLSINYSLNVAHKRFDKNTLSYIMKATNSLNFTGNLSLTAKWKIGFQSGYNIDLKELTQTNITVTKDLHCWTMMLNLVPTGKYKSYFFTIHVNSSILKDLKYDKRKVPRDNASYYQ